MTKRKQLETLLEIEAEAREKIRSLRRELRHQQQKNDELESEISALICVNEALSPKADGEKERLKAENAELKEQLKRAEMKLSAEDRTDTAFKENMCTALSFLGERVREINEIDEKQRRFTDFLFRAVEGLVGENLALKQQLGEEPGRAITIGEPRTEKETEQPETEDKKNDK